MLVHSTYKEVCKKAMSAWVLNNLQINLEWSHEFSSKTFHLLLETRNKTSVYKSAVEFFLDNTQFPKPAQATYSQKVKPNAWFDLKSRTISISDTITEVSDIPSKENQANSVNATATTFASTRLSMMSQSMGQDIQLLQHNIQKLSFCSKVIKAETGITQSNLFQASHSFEGEKLFKTGCQDWKMLGFARQKLTRTLSD